MAKLIRYNTKRLILTPLTEEEMMKLILTEPDEQMRRFYTTVLTEAREREADWNWRTIWAISLKTAPEEVVGTLRFNGTQKQGTVSADGALRAGNEDLDVMEEALSGLSEWAFSQQDVYRFMIGEADAQSLSEERLTEYGFHKDASLSEGLFIREKGNSAWLLIYLCLGICIGISFGIIGQNLPLGLFLGIVLGVTAGYFMDQSEKKHREEVTETGQDKEEH